jgi:thiamine biosynthesis protein ThiI
MAPQGTVLVRYGELALKKGSIRTGFERELVHNIKRLLEHKGIDGKVSRDRGRVFIATDEPRAAAEATSRVFGVTSCSVVETCGVEMDVIVDAVASFAAEHLPADTSFAVRARRAGSHSFTSIDVGKAVGQGIRDARPDLTVDLEAPASEVFVEVRQKEAYYFLDRVEGPGGLPLATQGRTAVLISGGIDSPVAAWLMMKRGCVPVFVHFVLDPFSDMANRDRAVDMCHRLKSWAIGRKVKLYLVPHGENLAEIARSCPHHLQCVLCRRMMYRISDVIAERERALSLTTGESLGQVASQTAENLFVENRVANRPVFRPLIGLDKLEIIRIGERIGTFEVSSKPAGCCTITPDRPEKRGKLPIVEEAEQALDIDALVNAALKGAKIVEVEAKECE